MGGALACLLARLLGVWVFSFPQEGGNHPCTAAAQSLLSFLDHSMQFSSLSSSLCSLFHTSLISPSRVSFSFSLFPFPFYPSPFPFPWLFFRKTPPAHSHTAQVALAPADDDHGPPLHPPDDVEEIQSSPPDSYVHSCPWNYSSSVHQRCGSRF